MGAPSAEPQAASYADVLVRALHSLTALVPAAEVCGLRLAVDVPGDGFLNNPVETAELIDLVNSPWVGVGLHADRCAGPAQLADWMEYLGWRLAAVCLNKIGQVVETCQAGQLMQLLDRAAFDGPIVVTGGSASWWRAHLHEPPAARDPAE